MFSLVMIDHPAGTVNVAPPGVTRDVSAASRSGVDFPSVVWPADGGAAAACCVIPCVKAANIRQASRVIRRIDM